MPSNKRSCLLGWCSLQKEQLFPLWIVHFQGGSVKTDQSKCMCEIYQLFCIQLTPAHQTFFGLTAAQHSDPSSCLQKHSSEKSVRCFFSLLFPSHWSVGGVLSRSCILPPCLCVCLANHLWMSALNNITPSTDRQTDRQAGQFTICVCETHTHTHKTSEGVVWSPPVPCVINQEVMEGNRQRIKERKWRRRSRKKNRERRRGNRKSSEPLTESKGMKRRDGERRPSSPDGSETEKLDDGGGNRRHLFAVLRFMRKTYATYSYFCTVICCLQWLSAHWISWKMRAALSCNRKLGVLSWSLWTWYNVYPWMQA